VALHSKLIYIPSELLELLKIEHEYVVLEPGSVVIVQGNVMHQGFSLDSLPCVNVALNYMDADWLKNGALDQVLQWLLLCRDVWLKVSNADLDRDVKKLDECMAALTDVKGARVIELAFNHLPCRSMCALFRGIDVQLQKILKAVKKHEENMHGKFPRSHLLDGAGTVLRDIVSEASDIDFDRQFTLDELERASGKLQQAVKLLHELQRGRLWDHMYIDRMAMGRKAGEEPEAFCTCQPDH
jgi:hypothetical protein